MGIPVLMEEVTESVFSPLACLLALVSEISLLKCLFSYITFLGNKVLKRVEKPMATVHYQ